MKKRIAKVLSLILVVSLLCTSIFVLADASYVEDSNVFRVTCSVNGDTQTQRGLCWYTKTNVETKVIVCKDGVDVTSDIALKDVQCMEWNGYYMHKVTLCDLEPGSTYSYQLLGDLGMSEPGTFTTDDGDDVVNFLGVADVQASSLENFLKGARTVEGGLTTQGKTDFVVNLGDFTNDSTNEEWDFYAEAFDKMDSNLTLAPVSGNHDGLGVWHWFDNMFNLDTSESVQNLNGVNYSFDYGNAHFAVLNTNDLLSISLSQLRWLKNDMNSTDKDWKIVFMHKSPYTLGKDGKWPDALFLSQSLTRVCEMTGVDLVMSGHDHQYLRTKSLKNGKVVDGNKGVTYVLSGTAGSKRYEVREFMLGHFMNLNKLAALTIQKGGKNDAGEFHQRYLQDGTLDHYDPNRVGGVFNTISIKGGKLTLESYVLKDLEEGETEDVYTKIDTFVMTKEVGQNKATFKGDNTTSAAAYAANIVPTFTALATYTFGNWLPRFLIMLPKLVYIVATKDIF